MGGSASRKHYINAEAIQRKSRHTWNLPMTSPCCLTESKNLRNCFSLYRMQEGWAWSQGPQNQVPGIHCSEPSITTYPRWYRTWMEGKLQISWRLVLTASRMTLQSGKAQAWKALNGMTKILSSSMKPNLKKTFFFLVTVVSIRLHGCERRSVTAVQEKSLNGTHTHTHTNAEKVPQCTLVTPPDRRPAVR